MLSELERPPKGSADSTSCSTTGRSMRQTRTVEPPPSGRPLPATTMPATAAAIAMPIKTTKAMRRRFIPLFYRPRRADHARARASRGSRSRQSLDRERERKGRLGLPACRIGNRFLPEEGARRALREVPTVRRDSPVKLLTLSNQYLGLLQRQPGRPRPGSTPAWHVDCCGFAQVLQRTGEVPPARHPPCQEISRSLLSHIPAPFQGNSILKNPIMSWGLPLTRLSRGVSGGR